jgi:hypothetical protein
MSFELLPAFEELPDFINGLTLGQNNKCIENLSLYFEKYREDLVAVVCDLKLTNDPEGRAGEDLIKKIRNNIEIKGISYYTKVVPIFAYTESMDLNRYVAIDNGATHLIEKKPGDRGALELIKQIDSTVNIYSDYRAYLDYAQGVSSEYFLSLVSDGKALQEEIEGVKWQIEGSMDSIQDQLSMILEGVLMNLSYDKKNEFILLYENELLVSLGEDKYKRFKKDKYKQWVEAVKAINQNGSIKEFVNATIDILNDVGLTASPKGRFFTIALKGIVGILSTSK